MSEDEQHRAARQRARELANFYRQAVTYVVVIVLLGIINLLTSSNDWWVQWPALGWGLFILWQAWKTFGPSRFFGREWEERKIAELMGEKPKHSSTEDYFDESATE